VIVDDRDVVRVPVLPAKTDPPLIVDSNAVLAGPTAAKFLQAIARWHAKLVESLSSIDDPELAQHEVMQFRREAAHTLTPEQPLSIAIGEAVDHGSIITRGVHIVKRY
jgi:hypothetical protein